MVDEEKGRIWLLNTWPIMTKCDHDWTMVRYDFPPETRQYIKNNWTKVGDQNGGVYEKPLNVLPLP
jgi:hypothetical protein